MIKHPSGYHHLLVSLDAAHQKSYQPSLVTKMYDTIPDKRQS